MKSRLELAISLLLVIVLISACTPAAGNEPSANELLNAKPNTPMANTAVPTSPTTETNTEPATSTNHLDNSGSDIAAIQGMQITLLESFPVQVNVTIVGMLPDGCTNLGPIDIKQTGNTFDVTVHTVRPEGMMCTQIVSEFEDAISLDVVGLKAGTYTVNLNGRTDTFTLDVDNGSPNEETPNLSEADMRELLRLTLTRALIEQAIPDYGLIADKENIVLSDEHINATLLPELPDIKLSVMKPEEIQKQADAEGDFLYLYFQEVTAVSDSLVRISLSNTWAVGKNSDMVYLSGGGFTIEYTRTADGWQGEITMEWIS